MEIAERIFDARASEFPGKVVKIKLESVRAASLFADGRFDLVYLDGGHDKESVYNDIKAWRPKIKSGGWIAGHDFDVTNPGVQQAVRELLGEPQRVFDDFSWVHPL